MSSILIRLLATALLTGAASAAAQPASKPLFRWVDESGQVHYGDKVPAKDAKQGRQTINSRGTVTKVVPRELKGAELAEAQARVAADKAAADARAQRIVYDKYLLQSFASVADLQAARDERLAALDARLTMAQNAVIENEKTLADLRDRVVEKRPDPKLKAQIESFENSLIDNLQATRKLRDERAAAAVKYAADIERFKGLRANTIAQGD